MPTFTIPGPAGALHVVDLREESPSPSGALPIVFVHGMVGHTGFWNTALAACADRRRAVALDLRGHGGSAAPSDGDYSIQACADDVLAVIDALGLDSIVLVGHSYGAHVVIDVAARRPEVVRRLILVDPPGDFTRVPDQVRDDELMPYLARLEGDEWRATVAADFVQANKGGTAETGATVQARLGALPQNALAGMFRSMMLYPASTSLEQYLAHTGADARAILAPPNAWPFSLHVLVPAVRAAVVPDVGHWIMLDAPERFVTELESAVAGT
jgi:pimeloyl-ACP methyl ester carboxylesterase